MPINKDALVRYRVINKYLINKFKKNPTKETLIEACREALGVAYISQRTFEKDLQEMRYNEELGYFAPIVFDKKEKGYKYSEEGYSIDKIPLKTDDLNALQFAVSILNQFSHLSILKEFSGAVAKIVDAVNINRIMAERPELDFILFDRGNYVAGGIFLEKIVMAIKDARQIEFSYKKHGENKVKQYILSPYILKEYRNIWYVIGQDSKIKEIKTFGLDRILEMRISNEAIEQNLSFDKKKYFKNAFGITSYHSDPVEVVLSFSKKSGDYIKAVPLHPSQQILADTEKELRIQLTVYPTYDFIMQLLSYGSEVEILSPVFFKKQIIEILNNTLNKYTAAKK